MGWTDVIEKEVRIPLWLKGLVVLLVISCAAVAAGDVLGVAGKLFKLLWKLLSALMHYGAYGRA